MAGSAGLRRVPFTLLLLFFMSSLLGAAAAPNERHTGESTQQ